MKNQPFLNLLTKSKKLPIIFYCKESVPKNKKESKKMFSDFNSRYKTEHFGCIKSPVVISKIIKL